MTDRRLDQLGTVAGLTASFAVGVPMLVDLVVTGGELSVGAWWLWWPFYLGHLGAFVIVGWCLTRPRWLPARGLLTDRNLVVGQMIFGGAAYALAPPFGWAAVLLVVTAATAAAVLSPRATILIVAVQAVLVAAVTGSAGMGTGEVAMSVLVYGSFMLFGALVVGSQRREADARQRLAEANLDLQAATVLLSETSRTTERLRIARDLHDVVGHQLTALALELEVAAHHSGPPSLEHVTRARAIAKDLLSDVRSAVGALRASTPDLRAALEAITARLQRPRIHLEVADDLAVDEERVAALVRCVQEIVTNAMRHADAANLWIELSHGRGGGTRLEARDDGRGIDELQPGNGLKGMRERIEGLGGVVRFDPGHGSTSGQGAAPQRPPNNSRPDGRPGFRVVAEVPAP